MRGSEFKRHRTDRLRLTQQALAEHLGVHKLTIGRWESARQVPPLAALAITALKGKGGRPRKRRR